MDDKFNKFLLIGYGICIIVLVLFVFLKLFFEKHNYMHEEAKTRSCYIICYPQASKIIDNECHCASKEGWMRND